MNKKVLIIVSLVLLAVLVLTSTALAGASLPRDLKAVKGATARYRDLGRAQADGYEAFLDCFDNPGVGGMGFHYVNFGIVDLVLDPLKPEAMVYSPAKNGKLKLGAVEYIVPADAWDAAGNSHPPMLMGQHFHLNAALGVYVLHAWIWRPNPAGVFEDWNPNVSCPAI